MDKSNSRTQRIINFTFRMKFSAYGAVLIEFAVTMPVLIILMMYIHDLALMKRYYDQSEFVALEMVNMLQNVSQKRANKAITANDLRHITAAAYLTMYPGTTVFWQNNRRLLVPFPHPFFVYVKGNANGTASVVWTIDTWPNVGCTAPSQITVRNGIAWHLHPVKNKTNVTPSEIHPKLTIKPGEVKIIVGSDIYHNSGSCDLSVDINGNRSLPAKKVFGFYLITPKFYGQNGGNSNIKDHVSFFNASVIFSPKPGLFSETAPK